MIYSRFERAADPLSPARGFLGKIVNDGGHPVWFSPGYDDAAHGFFLEFDQLRHDSDRMILANARFEICPENQGGVLLKQQRVDGKRLGAFPGSHHLHAVEQAIRRFAALDEAQCRRIGHTRKNRLESIGMKKGES